MTRNFWFLRVPLTNSPTSPNIANVMLRGVWYFAHFLSAANLRINPVTAGTVSSGDFVESLQILFASSPRIEIPSVDWLFLVMPVCDEYFVYFPLLPCFKKMVVVLMDDNKIIKVTFYMNTVIELTLTLQSSTGYFRPFRSIFFKILLRKSIPHTQLILTRQANTDAMASYIFFRLQLGLDQNDSISASSEELLSSKGAWLRICLQRFPTSAPRFKTSLRGDDVLTLVHFPLVIWPWGLLSFALVKATSDAKVVGALGDVCCPVLSIISSVRAC